MAININSIVHSWDEDVINTGATQTAPNDNTGGDDNGGGDNS